MRIIGVDSDSRQGQVLKNELRKVGFRLSELEFVTECHEDGWYMLFGSSPLKGLFPDLKMADVARELLHHPENENALIVPNYAPGYIYHNPNLKPLWIDGLEQAFVYYSLDVKGVIA